MSQLLLSDIRALCPMADLPRATSVCLSRTLILQPETSPGFCGPGVGREGWSPVSIPAPTTQGAPISLMVSKTQLSRVVILTTSCPKPLVQNTCSVDSLMKLAIEYETIMKFVIIYIANLCCKTPFFYGTWFSVHL